MTFILVGVFCLVSDSFIFLVLTVSKLCFIKPPHSP